MMGTLSIFVVRVISADASTTAPAERLGDSVFGNGADGSADPVTPRSQYVDCSYSQLESVEVTARNGINTNLCTGR